MAEETSTVRWAVGVLIALLAAGGGIAAIYNMFQPKTDGSNNSSSTSSPPVIVVLPNANPTTPVTVKTDCKVEGMIYNNENNAAMPKVKVYLVNKKNTEHYLVTNGADGKFAGDCSELSQEDFPQKLKIRTDSGFEWTDPDTVISHRGKSNINLWITEVKDAGNPNIKRIEVSRIRRAATINPDILRQVPKN
jgi:hypothetical protein